MPSAFNVRQTKPRSYYMDRLDAARSGSESDIASLVSELETTPPDLLPHVLDMFLSHLDVNKLQKSDGLDPRQIPVNSIRHMNASSSFQGVEVWSGSKKFMALPSASKTILRYWRSILAWAMVFYDNSLEHAEYQLTSTVIFSFIRIFQALFAIEKDSTDEICYDSNFQKFISKLWMRSSNEEDIVMTSLSSYLTICVRGRNGLVHLLQASGSEDPFDSVAKRMVTYFIHLLRTAHRTEIHMSYLNAACVLLSSLPVIEGRRITLALIKNKGATMAIKALRLYHKAVIKLDDFKVAFALSACFTFLHYCFTHWMEADLFDKVVRAGLIEAISGLSPRIKHMQMGDPAILSRLQQLLDIYIPRNLICIKSIRLAVKALENLSPEDKERISRSLIKESWSRLEALLVERLAHCQLLSARRRMFYCLACRGWNLRIELLACGRCRSATYCSSACQRKDWGRHKTICRQSQCVAEGPRKLPKVADISNELVSRDVFRYFESMMKAESETSGRFLVRAYDPTQHVLVLDYLQNPLHIEVLSFQELDLKYPFLAYNLQQWARRIMSEGIRMLCLVVTQLSKGVGYGFSRERLRELWDKESSLCNHHWNSGPPNAIAARNESSKWYLTPKVDALEDILSHCGSTVHDFLESDFDQRVLDWLRASLQGESSVFYASVPQGNQLVEIHI